MEPQKTLQSDALAANLKETRSENINIPDKHLLFTGLSENYFSIHSRAIDCIKEYNHPYSNSGYIIGQLRTISLGDYWFYDKQTDPLTWEVILELYEGLINRPLSDLQSEDLIHTLLELLEKLAASEKNSGATVVKTLELLNLSLSKKPDSLIHNSGFLIKLFISIQWPDNLETSAMELASKVLLANAAYWRDSTCVEKWLAERSKMFSPQSREKFASIGIGYLRKLKKKLQKLTTGMSLNLFLHLVILHFISDNFIIPLAGFMKSSIIYSICCTWMV
jgi:pyruvate, orthophosphate dikinase